MTAPTSNFTYTITTNGLTTGALHKTADPKPPPTDLIATRTQQTIGGWVGQILVAGRVVYETDPMEEAEDAIEQVNNRMLSKIADLFGTDPNPAAGEATR